MKKLIAAAAIIAACGTLCASVWPQNSNGEEGPAEVADSAMPAVETETTPLPQNASTALGTETTTMAEREKQLEVSAPAIAGYKPEPTASQQASVSATAVVTPDSADPYHTDIYPENIYSEEYLYDADENLIGKITTIPTAFGSDTIWINSRAYYDVPGFGLVEWSGPGQRMEDYTMYESGVKVGIMGDGDKASEKTAAPAVQSEDKPEPTGEVIDQTINEVQEKNSAPPNYKPNTTPPSDLNARTAPK